MPAINCTELNFIILLLRIKYLFDLLLNFYNF